MFQKLLQKFDTENKGQNSNAQQTITEQTPTKQIQIQNQTQKQIQLQELKTISEDDILFQNVIIEERDKEIHEISQQFYEINEIMQTMAQLVDQQGDIVDDIRSNIQKTDENVCDAKADIKEAEESQKKSMMLELIALAGTAGTVLITTLLVIILV